MSWRHALLLASVLATMLASGTASAAEPPPPSKERPTPTPPRTPELSEEDRDVVENLELLESLDTVEDLELLLELSKEEGASEQ